MAFLRAQEAEPESHVLEAAIADLERVRSVRDLVTMEEQFQRGKSVSALHEEEPEPGLD